MSTILLKDNSLNPLSLEADYGKIADASWQSKKIDQYTQILNHIQQLGYIPAAYELYMTVLGNIDPGVYDFPTQAEFEEQRNREYYNSDEVLDFLGNTSNARGENAERYANYLEEGQRYTDPNNKKWAHIRTLNNIATAEQERIAAEGYRAGELKQLLYEFAVNAQSGLFSKHNKLGENGDARSDGNSRYSSERAAQFINRKLEQNPELLAYLNEKGISANDLLKQMESTYAEHLDYGDAVTNVAVQNKARKEDSEKKLTLALVDEMHNAQNNFLSGAANLAFGTASNVLWNGAQAGMYGLGQLTGEQIGNADHLPTMEEIVFGGISAPKYASDVIFKGGTSGSKVGDFVVDTLGDPLAWAMGADVYSAAKNAGRGLRLIAPTAENLTTQTGRGMISETAGRVMPTVAESTIAPTNRAASRMAFREMAKIDKARAALEAAKASGNKNRIQEATKQYLKVMAQLKSTAVKTGSSHPTATSTVNERGNFPRGQETHIVATPEAGGMGYVPGQLETTVYPIVGTRLPSMAITDHTEGRPVFQRRALPLFLQHTRYMNIWKDTSDSDWAHTQAKKNNLPEGSVVITPSGKRIKIGWDQNYTKPTTTIAVNPNIGVTGQEGAITHVALPETYVSTHVPTEVRSLPLNVLSEKYVIKEPVAGLYTPTYLLGLTLLRQGGKLNYANYLN